MSQIRDHRTRALSYGGHEFVTIVRKGLKDAYRKQYVCIIHLILENIMSLLVSIYTSATGTSVNTANQTNDILQYPMDNKFIMYCSCVDAIVTIATAL